MNRPKSKPTNKIPPRNQQTREDYTLMLLLSIGLLPLEGEHVMLTNQGKNLYILSNIRGLIPLRRAA